MILNCLGNGDLQLRISQDGERTLALHNTITRIGHGVALPEGRPDMEQLEGTPGVLPFESVLTGSPPSHLMVQF